MLQGLGRGEKGWKPLKMYHSYLIALGSNLTSGVGTPSETLGAALNCLKNEGAVIRAVSPLYHTPAFPVGAGPDFVNAAAVLDVDWPAAEVLEVLHRVEARMGRERVQRWGQRTLDLDLIGGADLVLPDLRTYQHWRNLPLEAQIGQAPEQLILPHPRLQDRAFVLVPLADIAPDWIHPVLGLSVAQMLEALPKADKEAVKPLQ